MKLEDLYPTGESMLIADGIIRMRWRENSYQKITSSDPVFMESGIVYTVNVSVGNTSYVFNKGHAIRVAVSSSNYPRFSANFNNGKSVAEEGEPVVASNTLWLSNNITSYFTLPVVSLSQIPPSKKLN